MSVRVVPAPTTTDAVSAAPALSRTVQRQYRILMIAPTSFFADYGCHVRILEEVRVLQKMGHSVRLVTYHSGNAVPGVHIERSLPIPWSRDASIGSSRQKILCDILLSYKALRVAQAWRPDIIHGHLHEGALIGWPLALLMRTPLVFDFQGSLASEMVDHNFLDANGPFYKPMRRLENFINGLPAAIVPSTEHAARLCVERYGCRPDLVHALSDAVNADVFRPGMLGADERLARRRALGIPDNRHVVVYLGLLASYQGTDLLVRAAARLLSHRQDVQFLIMGYPGRHRYQRLAEDLGIADHITMPGRIPYEQAPEVLALGDIAVAPKLSKTEGSGKVLNYMSMALPTVAFDTPVNREYLAEDGVYAPAGDIVAFADRIRDLIDNADVAVARGMCLRDRVIENYSWDDAGRRLVGIYEQTLVTQNSKRAVSRAYP